MKLIWNKTSDDYNISTESRESLTSRRSPWRQGNHRDRRASSQHSAADSSGYDTSTPTFGVTPSHSGNDVPSFFSTDAITQGKTGLNCFGFRKNHHAKPLNAAGTPIH